MNKNVLIVLGGAVVVAILVAMLVQMSLGGGKQKQVATQDVPKVEILVASKDLGVGKELEDGDLKWQSWPKETLFSGAVQRKKGQEAAEALKGRLRRDVAAGEPMMASYLLGETKANFVAASLQPGMRAVTIEVSATTMVAGFISVGDNVDVVMTYRLDVDTNGMNNRRVREAAGSALHQYATESVVQNARVLAVDQTAQRPEDGKVRVGKTVTLELSVQDSERVILAQQIGELTLVLRGIGDDQTVDKKWPITSDMRLVGIDDEIREETKKIEKESSIRKDIVRIYNGGEVNAVPVQ